MTYKERTLKAVKELAHKYRNPEGEILFNTGNCSLCKIYFNEETEDTCRGCFMANRYGDGGCFNFKSFEKARKYEDYKASSLERKEAFKARAKFFDKVTPILENIPASQFTPSGWKYFDEISRDW